MIFGMALRTFGPVQRWWYRTPTAHVRMIAIALLAVLLLVAVVVWLTA